MCDLVSGADTLQVLKCILMAKMQGAVIRFGRLCARHISDLHDIVLLVVQSYVFGSANWGRGAFFVRVLIIDALLFGAHFRACRESVQLCNESISG